MIGKQVQTDAATPGLNRESIVERLVDLLRKRILSGEWQEGQQLRQEKIAEEYQISRMPVREALRQLEIEGFIVFKNNKGAEVSRLSISEIEELFDLRIILETSILSDAIANATLEDYRKADDALKKMDKAYEDGDSHLGGDLNWTFHNSLYQPAGKRHTLSIIRTLNYHTDRYVRLHLLLTADSASCAGGEHKAILDAFIAKDVRGAKALLKKHISKAKRDLLLAAATIRNEE